MTQPLIHADMAYAQRDAVETGIGEVDVLANLGFTEDEVASLLWLRQWYQSGGSDRMEIVRRLEYVQQLRLDGRLES